MNKLAFLFYGILFSIQSISAQECPGVTVRTGDTKLPTIAPLGPGAPFDTTLTSPPPSTGRRLVYYLHGLGGSAGAWSRAGIKMTQLYPKAISRFPDYNAFQNVTIPEASWVVRTDANGLGLDAPGQGANLAFGITDPEQNYVIGSSLGGVIAREMDRQLEDSGDPRRFGGLVTFGGANLGASILNDITKLEDFAVGGCDVLGDGPALDPVPAFLISILNLGPAIDDFTDKICATIGGQVVSTLLSEFNQPINEGYEEEGEYINGLNSTFSTAPKMAFYGIEQEPVFWRTMQFSGVFGVGPNDFSAFEANDDQPLWEDVKKAKLKYEEKRDWNYHLYQWHLNRYWEIGHKAKARGYKEKSDAWARGYAWWNTANDRFKTAAGLREQNLDPQVICLCQPSWSSQPLPANFVNGYCEPPSGFPSGTPCWSETVTSTLWTDYPSDGIVKESSAKYLPDATYPPVKMDGSSHFSMRNDENTGIVLRTLYDGGYDFYFKIDP